MTYGTWVSPEQYAIRNGVSLKTVYRHIKAGGLAAEKVGRQWRSKVTEYDHPNEWDYQAHQSFLADILGSASLEIRPYSDSFPAVYRWSCRIDDPSNALNWSTATGAPRAELLLTTEREYGWQFALEHLDTGRPHTGGDEIT